MKRPLNGTPLRARAPRRTVDPAIPRQVASPQSLTPLHRTPALYRTESEVAAPAVDTFRGNYRAIDECSYRLKVPNLSLDCDDSPR